MHISFLISSLRCGGAEHVVSALANQWVSCGHTLTIITLSGPEVAAFYPLDQRVKHLPLGLQRDSKHFGSGLVNNTLRIFEIRKKLKQVKPDVLISFMAGTNVQALLAAYGLSVPVIISERGVPGLQSLTKLWQYLSKLCYPSAQALVVPSSGMCPHFKTRLNISPVVIANPVMIPQETPYAEFRPNGKRVVAAGRLSPEKGFDLLLKSFAQVAERYQDASLTIYGEGPERDTLMLLAQSLGIEAKVRFAGVSRDLSSELQTADIFVMSSLHESFGNVLCEAMAVGLAVVSFDCPTGPADIIKHQVDGILVKPNNVSELANTIIGLIADPERRRKLAVAAREIRTRLHLVPISQRWEQLIKAVVQAYPKKIDSEV